MTVIGIVSTAPAREVRLAFSDGTEAAAPLRDLASAVSCAGQGAIRYAVLALPGAHCILTPMPRLASPCRGEDGRRFERGHSH
jgi:hypothetical protein